MGPPRARRAAGGDQLIAPPAGTSEEVRALKAARFQSCDSGQLDEERDSGPLVAAPGQRGSGQDISERGELNTMQHWIKWEGVGTKDRAAMLVEQLDLEKLSPSARTKLEQEAPQQAPDEAKPKNRIKNTPRGTTSAT
jgi:hypothetical protein